MTMDTQPTIVNSRTMIPVRFISQALGQDVKTGDREDYPTVHENAPQGDEQRVFNMVCVVRVVE